MANIPFALYLLTSDSSGPSHRVKTGTDEGWVCWGRCHCGTQTAVPEGGSEGACGGPPPWSPIIASNPMCRGEQRTDPGELSKAQQTFWSLEKALKGPMHPPEI